MVGLMNWRVFAAALALFAVYFPVAIYFKMTYVPPPQQPRERIWLTGPFIHAGGAAYIAELPRFNDLADSNDEPFQSPLILQENELPIGSAHERHSDIATLGGGRYSHWKDQGLVFSSSDNSDPNQNWKRYSVVRDQTPTRPW